FDIEQALVGDTYFFGRQSFVLDLLDRFKRGENTGLFGLRKSGKTSAIFKLKRLVDADSSGTVVYVDAQNPQVYGLRWWELLNWLPSGPRIILCSAWSVPATYLHSIAQRRERWFGRWAGIWECTSRTMRTTTSRQTMAATLSSYVWLALGSTEGLPLSGYPVP